MNTHRRTAVAAVLLAVLLALAQGIPTPTWNAGPFQELEKYGGRKLINGTKWTRLYFGTTEVGFYAMSPMISFFSGGYAMLATWKVGVWREDGPGQLVRFAQSMDGENWVNVSADGKRLDAPGILFPRMNSTENPDVHLFAEPTLYIDGRGYAAASPKQLCLYPDQFQNILLLRRVYPGIGNFGPVFWAAKTIPKGYAIASKRENVTTYLDQDATTRADIESLTPHQTKKPCDLTVSTKCEFCVGGCQDWNVALRVPHMENERTHYTIKGTNASILLYRNNNNEQLVNHLFYSYRAAPGENWSIPVETNITNDVANLNAGPLPDGRRFLITNIMPYFVRNPMFIALSDDGLRWTSVAALGSCFQDFFTNPGQPCGCTPRHQAGGIQGGLQYPQAIAVTGNVTKEQEGYYTILSQNKEDIWVSKTPFSSFDY